MVSLGDMEKTELEVEVDILSDGLGKRMGGWEFIVVG